jgi:hypothetical protein
VHDGATLNACGGTKFAAPPVLQQICPLQSLSSLHAFGQVAEHVPLQQIAAVVGQSDEVEHDFGHGSYAGFKQRPAALRLGSIVFTEVQHTSPLLVAQSLLVLHAFGHSFAGTQIDWL